MKEMPPSLAKAMASKERVDFRPEVNISAPYPIYFNQNGNVNMAQTIMMHKGSLTVSLGTGYLDYEN